MSRTPDTKRTSAASSTASFRRPNSSQASRPSSSLWLLPGRINSLSQTLIKMIVSGVPDFYQGTELWDLSLVDPDNRRPVDFELAVCAAAPLPRALRGGEAVRDWDSGLPKLWMTARVLALRRERPQEFSDRSKYQPLVAQGAHLGNVLAFPPRRESDRGGGRGSP